MKVALAGNPNSGKTTLFNSLTGSTAHVGNWPGVTVEKRTGTYKKLGDKIEIVDLPGIYSLSPYTAEEVVSRDYILYEKPDVVINVVDATNLERNLYLTTQLLEIDVPVVVALNMMDVVKKSGNSIDTKKLSKELGVPVVEISALKETNLTELMKEAKKVSETKREGQLVSINKELYHLINDVKIAFKGKGIENPLFHAVKLVELDELETKDHQDLLPMVEEFKKTFSDDVFGDDYEALIADARYQHISKHYSVVLTKSKEEKTSEKLTKSDKIDKVLTHKIWALPIFVVIMFLIFHVTFSEDILFLHRILQVPAITHEGWVNFFTGMKAEEVLAEGGLAGIPSIGAFLQSWFGFLTGSLGDWIGSIMPAGTWYTSLVCDGIITGLDMVLSFVPQIMILFLFIAILEDSGYMARVAFILDRAFRKFGLSGKAFIPMLTGFGCSVPAIMATRTLEDEREKNRTIRLMTCFSCGAKAPVWALLAGVGALAGFAGDIFVFTIYLGGIAAAIVYALFMKLFSKDKYVSPFIMELPSYHMPQFRNVMAHLWDKLKHYLIKAATIILASTIVIWFLKSFGVEDGKFQFLMFLEDEEYVLHIENSILAFLGRGFAYFYYPLGWAQGVDGWKYAVATLTGLIAKEDVVATLGVLGLAEDTVLLSGAGVYAFAVYNLFTIPCFAAIGAAFGEQNRKEFWLTMLWWFAMSYVASLAVYWIGMSFTVHIALGIGILVAVIGLVVAAGIIVSKRNKAVVA